MREIGVLQNSAHLLNIRKPLTPPLSAHSKAAAYFGVRVQRDTLNDTLRVLP
jgi:hypothetical protein